MFFHRKRVTPYHKQRNHDRVPLPDAEDLVVELMTGEDEVVPAELYDLHIQGSSVMVPTEGDPDFPVDEVVQITVAHPLDGWNVVTPARVARKVPHGAAQIMYGLEFINSGNLYSQLDTAMGRYFNRRRGLRVEPALDAQIVARIVRGAEVLGGKISDLSRVGASVEVDFVAGQGLKPGTSIELAFKLPAKRKELRGGALIRHSKTLGNKCYVGIEFDLEDPKGFRKHDEMLAGYVFRRHEEMAAFESSFDEDDNVDEQPLAA